MLLRNQSRCCGAAKTCLNTHVENMAAFSSAWGSVNSTNRMGGWLSIQWPPKKKKNIPSSYTHTLQYPHTRSGETATLKREESGLSGITKSIAKEGRGGFLLDGECRAQTRIYKRGYASASSLPVLPLFSTPARVCVSLFMGTCGWLVARAAVYATGLRQICLRGPGFW